MANNSPFSIELGKHSRGLGMEQIPSGVMVVMV
jgi:hypothetical protein